MNINSSCAPSPDSGFVASIVPVGGCSHCAGGTDSDQRERIRMLHILALIEHPTALPADASLRLAAELLRLCDTDDETNGSEPTEATPIGQAA